MTAQTHGLAATLTAVFGVLADGRSYLNVLYLLLAFPLGIAYFVFLITGLSLGLGLLIIWIGVLVLALVFLGSWGLAAFERQQAIWLLRAEIGPTWTAVTGRGFWPNTRAFLEHKVTWTGPIFLFLKFPLGVASFVFTVVSLTLSLTLLLAPLYYRVSPPDLYWWVADTLPEALLCSLVGFLLFVASLHLLNALAWVWRELAVLLLGRRGPGSESAAPPAVEAAALAE